jgi:hypothetical protein
LELKNTFTNNIESARAVVFLLDDQGKMVGQAAHWIIGGTKAKPGLAANERSESRSNKRQQRLSAHR